MRENLLEEEPLWRWLGCSYCGTPLLSEKEVKNHICLTEKSGDNNAGEKERKGEN